MSNDFSNVLCVVVVVVHNEISEDDSYVRCFVGNGMRAHFPCTFLCTPLHDTNVRRTSQEKILLHSREIPWVCVCVCVRLYMRLICCPAKFLTLTRQKMCFFFVFPKYSYYVSRKSAPPPGKRLKAPNFIVRTRFHSFCFLFAFFIMYCCFIKCIIQMYTKIVYVILFMPRLNNKSNKSLTKFETDIGWSKSSSYFKTEQKWAWPKMTCKFLFRVSQSEFHKI